MYGTEIQNKITRASVLKGGAQFLIEVLERINREAPAEDGREERVRTLEILRVQATKIQAEAYGIAASLKLEL